MSIFSSILFYSDALLGCVDCVVDTDGRSDGSDNGMTNGRGDRDGKLGVLRWGVA